MNIEIKKLTPELAADYFDFFENRAFTDDSPYRCYCQMYQMSKEQVKTTLDNADGLDNGLISRKAAEQQIEASILRGYLTFVDGMAVVCFEIAPEYRGKGVATALLQRVIDDARAEGYTAVEGYPILRDERYEWDCTGPMRLYEKVGFIKVDEREKNIVMRKELK